MLFKSVVEKVVKESFSALLMSERTAYIQQIGKAWDFYNGFQKQYIKRLFKEDDDEFALRKKPVFNYTKTVVDEYVNGVFGRGFEIKFTDESLQEDWKEIVTPLWSQGVYPFFETVQRVAEISDTCAVAIRWNDSDKSLSFEDIRGEFIHVIPDTENPRRIGAIVISYQFDTGVGAGENRLQNRIEIWSRDKYLVAHFNRAKKSYDVKAQGDNPYGFIPIELFQPQGDEATFYGKSSVLDVVEVNDVYNNLWSALMRICDFQSFSLLFIRSDNDIQVDIAPTRFLKLPDSEKGDAKYITPDAKIGDVLKVAQTLKDELRNIARVPEDVVSTGDIKQPQSGYSLRIKRMPIEQQWKARRKSYGPTLVQLAKKALYVKRLHETGRKIELEGEIAEIDFSSFTAPLSPEEQQVIDNFELKHGIISPIDILLRKNPDMTREEAAEQIKRNLEEKRDLLGAGGLENGEGDYDYFMRSVRGDDEEDEEEKEK